MGEAPAVLLIDNNLADVDTMQQAFEEYWPEAELRVAWDGQEGIDVLAAMGDADADLPDLVILDLHLAVVHGRDLLMAVKRGSATRHLPVVILTSTHDDLEREWCLANGAIDFITKPPTFRAFAQLLERFRQIIGGAPTPAP